MLDSIGDFRFCKRWWNWNGEDVYCLPGPVSSPSRVAQYVRMFILADHFQLVFRGILLLLRVLPRTVWKLFSRPPIMVEVV
jgi:hypothetical protein